MANILICDDDVDIVSALKIYLSNEDYKIYTAFTGKQALDCVKEHDIDLVLMDVMMPEMDGIAATAKLREEYNIPVILLTAKSESSDKVLGLNVGADDYVTKPFSPSELVARVDAVYRRVSLSIARPPEDEGRTLISGPFSINTKSRIFTKNGTGIEITQVEYQLLEYFMENSGSALDRRSILTHIWGNDYYGDDKIVDVNIRRLRMKIEEDPSNPRYITTIWGYGYKWCVDELAAAGEFSR